MDLCASSLVDSLEGLRGSALRRSSALSIETPLNLVVYQDVTAVCMDNILD